MNTTTQRTETTMIGASCVAVHWVEELAKLSVELLVVSSIFRVESRLEVEDGSESRLSTGGVRVVTSGVVEEGNRRSVRTGGALVEVMEVIDAESDRLAVNGRLGMEYSS